VENKLWSIDDYRAITIGCFLLLAGLACFSWLDTALLQHIDALTTGKFSRWHTPDELITILAGYKSIYISLWIVLLIAILNVGARHFSENHANFSKGFIFVALIGILAFIISANDAMMDWGFGYAAWAIVLGLLISNTLGTPKWAEDGIQTGFYIKTGLVLLGAEVLFGKIIAIGLPGLTVAWVVTPIVLVSTFWFGQKILKIPSRTLNITISADMSVCGVSAAVATAAACKAKKEELTLAVGLSMLFTSMMMVVMPLLISFLGLPEILGGAWIGGTIDSTGAVAVAGEFLGENALYVAATIKMIQNILIGIVAFFVAIYFAKTSNSDEQISAGVIWQRFPKFILGFIGTSIVFSLIHASLPGETAVAFLEDGVIKSYSKNLRGWFFCLAFVSIGLSTNFKELKSYFKGGKPLILYVCGQTFNILFTLTMAYIAFYLLFPEITEGLLNGSF